MSKRKNSTARVSVTNADFLNSVITSNKVQFKLGSTITSDALCTMVGLPAKPKSTKFMDVQQHNLRKLGVYATMNKLLALRGLAIKSKGYYASFNIVEKDDVKARVKQYKAIAKGKRHYSSTLKEGFATHNGKWTKLDATELKKAATEFSRNFH